MADNCPLSVDNIKKEPEECPSDDLESIDHCFGDDNSVKEEPIEKDVTETAKSDDDLQGYEKIDFFLMIFVSNLSCIMICYWKSVSFLSFIFIY